MNLPELILEWETVATVTTAWLLTYLIHSTLLLGGVWALVRWGRTGGRTEERLWRGVLIAGLVTATVQLAAGWGPQVFRFGETEARASSGPERVVVRTGAVAPADLAEVGRAFFEGLRADAAARPEIALRADAGDALAVGRASLQEGAAESEGIWSDLWADGFGGFVLLWLLGVIALGAWRTAEHAAFRWKLRDRRPVRDASIRAMLARLAREAGWSRSIRCTRSQAVSAPVLVSEREICLPGRFVEELTTEQQRMVMAHEVAHVVREDRWWTGVALALETLFFFQPLHRVARRRLRDRAEEQADRWAARRTGSSTGMAEALLTVARWVHGGARSDLAPGVMYDGSGLERRIRSLLAGDEEEGESWVRPALALGALTLVVACAGPGVATRSSEPELNGPEVSARVTDDPEIEGPEIEGPEIEGPEIAGPEMPGPPVDGPKAVRPGRPPAVFFAPADTSCPCPIDRAVREALEAARAEMADVPLDSIVDRAMREAEFELERFARDSTFAREMRRARRDLRTRHLDSTLQREMARARRELRELRLDTTVQREMERARRQLRRHLERPPRPGGFPGGEARYRAQMEHLEEAIRQLEEQMERLERQYEQREEQQKNDGEDR